MTSPEKKRAVIYAREVPEPEHDPERFIYLFDKWDGLSKALDADADLVAVSFPESARGWCQNWGRRVAPGSG